MTETSQNIPMPLNPYRAIAVTAANSRAAVAAQTPQPKRDPHMVTRLTGVDHK